MRKNKATIKVYRELKPKYMGSPQSECRSDDIRSKRKDKPNNGLCKYCGEYHNYGSSFCPAFGTVCKICKKENHYARVCKSLPKYSARKVSSKNETDSEIQKIHVKIKEIERKVYDIGFERFREKENRNWEKCQVKSLESDSEEKELEKKHILDFANAILENSTHEISDLKTGKVWLELANGIYQKNYKAKANARKNYNAVLKMLQANGVDGYFIINHFDDILDGDEEANMNVAVEMEHIFDYSENEVYMKEIDAKSGRYDEEDC